MKRWLFSFLAILGFTPALAEPASTKSSQFIFVKIPEAILPIERGKKYEDPLDAVLKDKKVGEVSGGGTQMSKPDKNGKSGVEWVGVDVDLTNFDIGLPLLKAQLIRLGVPSGTVLEYTRDGVKHAEPVK